MKCVALAVFFLVLGSAVFADAGPDPIAVALMSRVTVLTSPDMAGRGAGSSGGRAAGDTIAAWFDAIGLQPAFGSTWFQEFPLHGEGWSGQPLAGKTGRNVAGLLKGKGSLASHYVLVSAHYDHLGRSDVDNLGNPPDPDSFFPGANDNASGVTVLIDAARNAQVAQSLNTGEMRSVLFVSFDGEEVGLQGSLFMADHLPVPLASIDAVINLDTVGQLGQGKLYVSGVGTTAIFTELARKAGWEGFTLSLAPGGWSGSDHMTFNRLGIPVLFIFGGPYPQYNRPADLASSLDPVALGEVARYTTALLALVRQTSNPLTWIKIDEPTAPASGEASGNRNTWLGTIPDFEAGIVGYKIGDVFDGSPAAAAGLAKGDVLQRFGGQDVTDLATFTRALRSFAPGSPVEITLLREGRSLNFTVVLGDRSQRR